LNPNERKFPERKKGEIAEGSPIAQLREESMHLPVNRMSWIIKNVTWKKGRKETHP